jgi:D-methionine transport system ATP-binding protein
VITLTHIAKRYATPTGSTTAIADVSLTVQPGEIFGIIGLSGAGKSTLIRCINLLERPDSGTVQVDGRELTGLSETDLRAERRKIGMIFQQFNLLSSRTVASNIAFPMEISGVARAEIGPRVKELLDLVGLADKADAYPAQLSGGQKQRVGIARALANRPAVLLSDESTSALDPQTTRSILALLRDINRRLGLTIVLITHDMDVIRQICDRVAVLEGGQIVEQGPVIDIFSRPQSTTTRAFLQDMVAEEELPEWFTVTPGALVIHVTFVGPAAVAPVISRLVHEYHVEANILRGHIDRIAGQPFGVMTLELRGAATDLEAAHTSLLQQGLLVEAVTARA